MLTDLGPELFPFQKDCEGPRRPGLRLSMLQDVGKIILTAARAKKGDEHVIHMMSPNAKDAGVDTHKNTWLLHLKVNSLVLINTWWNLLLVGSCVDELHITSDNDL